MYTTARETLRLLEWRLARLEFYLNSDEPAAEGTNAQTPVSSRLTDLEDRFANICSKHPSAKEILHLHERFPDLSSDTTTNASESGPSTSNKLQIVLSSAPSFPATVSTFNSIREYPVPDPRPFASLVTLRSSIDRARARQELQAREVDELRQRSASLLAAWYQSRILDGGEQWSELEERLGRVEQTVRRMETAAIHERDGT